MADHYAGVAIDVNNGVRDASVLSVKFPSVAHSGNDINPYLQQSLNLVKHPVLLTILAQHCN